MPFESAELMQKQSTPIGQTFYENPDKAGDIVHLLICKPAVIVETEELKKTFGGDASINLDSIAQVLSNYSQKTLSDMVAQNQGTLKFNLDGKEVVLHHKTHFFLNAKDKAN